MSFREFKLDKKLLAAIESKGFVDATPIQKKSFSPIKSGRDFIGLAQTGTGKTLAYLLPILSVLKYTKQHEPRVLIIAPTRELVMQVHQEILLLTENTFVRSAAVFGGTNINTQKLLVVHGIDVVVGTPGRLMDLCLNGAMKLNKIKHLIIDEVDEMFDLGFRPQLLNIFDLLSKKRQNIMFSATLSPDIEKLINAFFESPLTEKIVPHGTPLDLIIQQYYLSPNFTTKINLLQVLLADKENFTKVLIFASGKKMADKIFELIDENFENEIGVIHSNKSQNYRFRNVQNFEAGEIRILLATDLISRGLDFHDISHVINFDFPQTAIQYIHRIGRTGRADSRGIALSFIQPKEQEVQMEVENLMKRGIDLLEIPETVEVTDELLEFEKAQTVEVNYLGIPSSMMTSQGAFHEKKDKNKKVNLGSPRRKNKKVQNRSGRGKKK